jgi:hypothetical protein
VDLKFKASLGFTVRSCQKKKKKKEGEKKDGGKKKRLLGLKTSYPE